MERPEQLKLLAQEIVLLAPEKSGIGSAAGDALEALSELRRYRHSSDRPPHFLHEKESLDGYQDAVGRLDSAIQVFIDRAKRDLGAE